MLTYGFVFLPVRLLTGLLAVSDRLARTEEELDIRGGGSAAAGAALDYPGLRVEMGICQRYNRYEVPLTSLIDDRTGECLA